MPLMAGMLSSIGPTLPSTPQAPSDWALLYAKAEFLTAEGDGADRRAVHAGEALGEAVLLGVDDEVHVALAIERDVLGAVLGDLHEAHALEQLAEGDGIGSGVLDELEAVGAHGIDVVDRCGGFHHAGHVDLPN